MGIDFDIAAVNEQALTWANEYVKQLVGGIVNTTRSATDKANEAYAAAPEMSKADLLALLAFTFGAARADMIAITEVTRAYSQATSIVQKLLAVVGVATVRIWETARDDRVCPLCGPLDGKPQSEWGDFPDGPPAHANCRCRDRIEAVRTR
jgi:hypothetical protein